MRTLSRHPIRGGTLLEVLMAIMLVATAAMVITATMPVANVSRARANNMTRAAGLAMKELESIRGIGYSNATPTQLYGIGLIDSDASVGTGLYTFNNVDGNKNDSPAIALPSGYATVLIEQVDLDLRRVTVAIYWSEKGVTRSYKIGTLIANL